MKRTWRPEFVIVNKRSRDTKIGDVAVPGDFGVLQKEVAKKSNRSEQNAEHSINGGATGNWCTRGVSPQRLGDDID